VISIEINGQKLDIKDNLLLKDAIETAKAFYIPETTIGILKTAGKKEEATSEYKILTTKGELKIELFGDSTLWTKFSHFFTDINAHWESRYAIALAHLKQILLWKGLSKNIIAMMFLSEQVAMIQKILTL